MIHLSLERLTKRRSRSASSVFELRQYYTFSTGDLGEPRQWRGRTALWPPVLQSRGWEIVAK